MKQKLLSIGKKRGNPSATDGVDTPFTAGRYTAFNLSSSQRRLWNTVSMYHRKPRVQQGRLSCLVSPNYLRSPSHTGFTTLRVEAGTIGRFRSFFPYAISNQNQKSTILAPSILAQHLSHVRELGVGGTCHIHQYDHDVMLSLIPSRISARSRVGKLFGRDARSHPVVD